MSKIDTLENVTMVTGCLIPEEDKQAVDRIWQEFSETFSNLVSAWKQIIALDQENTRDTYYFSGRSVTSGNANPYVWSFKFDILHAEQLMSRALVDVEQRIIEYFNRKYHTAYKSTNVLRDSVFDQGKRYTGQTPELDILIKHLITLNEGCSFTEKGDSEYKARVGRWLRCSMLKVTGTSVSISNAWSIPRFSEFLYNSDRLNLLNYLEAISYCMYGHPNTPVIDHDDVGKLADHPYTSTFEPKSVLLKSIRFVKSDEKVVFRFLNRIDAQKFYDFLVEQKAAA